MLGIGLGGTFAALLDLLAARVLGTPVPSGLEQARDAVSVPWPLFAFTAAPIGALVGAGVALALAARTWRRDVRRFTAVDAGPSLVARHYAARTATADERPFRRSRAAIARAWATGLMADSAGMIAGSAAAGLAVAVVTGAAISLSYAHAGTDLPAWVHGAAATESLLGLLLAGYLVKLLRSAYRSPDKRRTIGALWDVGTFWPRATHPFAPPCYAERAIPELVDRVRILTGTVAPNDHDPAWAQIEAHERDADRCPGLAVPTGPLLLTGYSQGSVIAPTVVAQLPVDTRRRVALLTLACPTRRLYGRAFPAFFGREQLATLERLLEGRWRNLVRRSDYIGSWIDAPLPDDPLSVEPTDVELETRLDQRCLDPVTVTRDDDPSPPPIHRHTGFWPDPCVTRVGEYLVRGLLPPDPGPARTAVRTWPAQRVNGHRLLDASAEFGPGADYRRP